MEFIDIRELLEFAPLIYPLQNFYFNQVLQIGKATDDNGDVDNDTITVEG